jgi:nitrite reductase/ring-hydroxylating ferredoxin subunit
MAGENWVRVAAVAEVPEGEIVGRRVGDKEIALYHLASGEYRATSNICTHEFARLSDGWLDGAMIECPLHAAQFDVRSGEVMAPPAETNLETFEVRVDGDDLLVKLPG